MAVEKEAPSSTRQEYVPPTVTPLGSVHELTLGSTPTAMPESGGSGNSQV